MDSIPTSELLEVCVRQTREIDFSRRRVREIGGERREVYAELRNRGVSFRRIADETGLHKMTIQQDMQRYRKRQEEALYGSIKKETMDAFAQAPEKPEEQSGSSGLASDSVRAGESDSF